MLPDRCLQARGLDPAVERGFLQGGAAATRSKTRPDMMIVEMTTTELGNKDNSSGDQDIYIPTLVPHTNRSGKHQACMQIVLYKTQVPEFSHMR